MENSPYFDPIVRYTIKLGIKIKFYNITIVCNRLCLAVQYTKSGESTKPLIGPQFPQ